MDVVIVQVLTVVLSVAKVAPVKVIGAPALLLLCDQVLDRHCLTLCTNWLHEIINYNLVIERRRPSDLN